MTDVIEVVAYDPEWPRGYEAERDRILEVLNPRIAAVEHIGSTAVPGLAAKPTLDLMVGVEALEVDPEVVESLEGLGYRYLGEYGIPGRHFFRKGLPPTHHLHWVVLDGEFWTRQLVFRDYLRCHPAEAEQYEALKQRLAERYRNRREAYTESKGDLIQEILEKARCWHKRDWLVVDLEATCWPEPRPVAEREIIEVGAVRLDPGWQPRGEFTRLVRPTGSPELTALCRRLTGIRQEEVDGADPWPVVQDELDRWLGTEPVTFCSWGAYDHQQLEAECRRHRLSPPPAIADIVDLREVHARFRGTEACPTPEALASLDLTPTGRPHRGLDDARNVARIGRALFA